MNSTPLYKSHIPPPVRPLLEEAEFDSLVSMNRQMLFRTSVMDVHRSYVQQWLTAVHEKKRRGEVVLLIQDAEERILLHNKSFYPKGIYRLLTGGIQSGESVRSALRREAFEETGLVVEKVHPLAIQSYLFRSQNISAAWISYVFLLRTANFEAHVHDVTEQISHFAWIASAELQKVALDLQHLDQDWRDWGRMRAVAHQLVLEWMAGTA